MFDNDIIKALEEELKTALIINHRFEESNDTENPDDHKFIALLINTIDLIKRQKAEIERLQDIIDNGAEVCGHCHEKYAHKIAQSKADAIKKFAERLKEKTYPFPCAIGVEHAITIRAINDTAKEMMEGNE